MSSMLQNLSPLDRLRSIRARLLGVVLLFAVAMIALVGYQSLQAIGEIYAARKDQLSAPRRR